MPARGGHAATLPMTVRSSERRLCGFVAGTAAADPPPPVRARLGLALADLAAVCAAGRRAPAAAIAADHAAALHPVAQARSLLDGRALGATGAAFANGVLANALDFDDGHRLTKGHPGAVVIPAALAVAQLVDATAAELDAAVLVGYEVAIRAGIALHRRDRAYHGSGAWGAVGAAAAAARLLGLDGDRTLAALGLAEYHAPIAPIMRSVAAPQMTKDACAWGAATGVSCALLAGRGFTSVRGELLDAPELEDLGRRWRLAELYVKAHPCCRWSQPAIAATLAATGGRPLASGEVTRVTIRTFAAADALAKLVPRTTEEAQYSLVWPVAWAAARGRFDVAAALGPFSDPEPVAMLARIEVQVDPALTAAFPERRLSAVRIECRDGRRLSAGPLPAPGEPGDPRLAELVAAKLAAVALAPEPDRGGRGPRPDRRLRELDHDQLLRLMCDAAAVTADG